jgi:hypothetical protein
MSVTVIAITETAAAAIQASLSIFNRVLDIFLPAAEILIEVKGADYSSERVPIFWLWRHEEGSSATMSIRGKPSFCEAAVVYLTAGAAGADAYERGERVDYDAYVVPVKNPIRRTRLGRIVDVFQLKDEMRFEANEPGYELVKSAIFWERERGASCRIAVKGKPGFCRAVLAHLTDHAPLLRRLLLKRLHPATHSALR